MTQDADILPDDIDALRAALLAERAARYEAETRASGAEALITHLKLLIAKLQRDRFGPTSERNRRLLDQLELQLEELEADTAEAEAKRPEASDAAGRSPRGKPVRGPLPAHLPRERVVIPGPTECPCCHGKLVKLGEAVTETLEVIPRQWKVIQTVREKFTCRTCESITQPPAPFHPIARGRAGPELLAMILEAKFGQHLPLNRQSEAYAREDIHLDVSTLGDWVGACSAALAPLVALIRAHVLAGGRIHGDDTTVPVLAKSRTITGRLWTYVRDDRPFADPAPPAAMFFYSRDRTGEHPRQHLAAYAGVLQADAYAGFNDLYFAGRKPGPVTEAACWAELPKVPRAQRVEWQRRGMDAASSTCWPMSPRPRSPLRQCVGSTPSSPSSATSTGCLQRRGWRCGRSGSRRWSRHWKLGCVPSVRACPGTTTPAGRWTTCSSAGPPSRGSSTTGGSVSATTPPNGHSAASPWGGRHGCSPDLIAAASVQRQSTASSSPPSSMASIRGHGSPMSCAGSQLSLPTNWQTCCRGTGQRQSKRPPQPETYAPRCSPDGCL